MTQMTILSMVLFLSCDKRIVGAGSQKQKQPEKMFLFLLADKDWPQANPDQLKKILKRPKQLE